MVSGGLRGRLRLRAWLRIRFGLRLGLMVRLRLRAITHCQIMRGLASSRIEY